MRFLSGGGLASDVRLWFQTKGRGTSCPLEESDIELRFESTDRGGRNH